VRMKISHREVVAQILRHLGLDDARLPTAFDLLDKRDRIEPAAFAQRWVDLGSTPAGLADFDRLTDCHRIDDLARVAGEVGLPDDAITGMTAIAAELRDRGLEAWAEIDLGIVRGLAYYTGTVFELHEVTGRERAMGGGGRYDQLVELFGGPPTPAVGFAMGDVVMRLVLETHGLLDEAAAYRPAPDVFLINVRDDDAAFRRSLTDLRRSGLHVRHSARSTRNVGKLLGEAGRVRARLAVILGRELDDGQVTVKDLTSGEQTAVEAATLLDDLRERLGITPPAPPTGGGNE